MDNIQKKIEDRIIDSINMNAEGRLIIFRPEKQLNGADLIVKKKGEYESRQSEVLAKSPIVKARVFGGKKSKPKEEIFLYIKNKDEKFDIPELSSAKNFYVIFVSFDALKQDIDESIRIIRLEDKKEFLINKKGLSNFFLM